MIETISVQFRSRADCCDWAERINAQIRAARQSAVLPSKLSVQPVPPPHVSVAPRGPGPGHTNYYYAHTPPYVGFTAWIRESLATKKLTLNHIKSLQRPARVTSESSASGQGRSHKVECVIYPSTSQLNTLSDAGDSLLDKSPVVLKDPQTTESNPFGYIHYISSVSDNCSEKDFQKSTIAKENIVPSVKKNEISTRGDSVCYNEEDMARLLPRSLLHSSSDSQSRSISRNDTIHSMGVSNETEESFNPGVDIGPWGKKLPPTNQFDYDPMRKDSRFRISSDGYYNQRQKESTKTKLVQSFSAPVLNKAPEARTRKVKVKVQSKHQRDFLKEESPPDWLSCFSSPRPRRKHYRRPQDVYSKSSSSSDSLPLSPQCSIKYIDKTPSENSLNLPYCPPVKLDYEQFSQLDYLSPSKDPRKKSASSSPAFEGKRESRRNSRTDRPELAVIPVCDQTELPVSPRPVRKHRSQVVAQIGMYPSHTGHQSHTGLDDSKTPPVHRRCVCDSRRSSDSGLADMTGLHQRGCPQGSQPGIQCTDVQTSGPPGSLSGIQTNLSPTMSRQSRLNSAQTSPSTARRGVTRDTRVSVCTCGGANTSLASGYSTQTCNSLDSRLNAITTHHRSQRLKESKSEKSFYEKPTMDSQKSVSLNDVKMCDKKTDNASSNPPSASPVIKSPQWRRTKEIYTTGLYAHWFLNTTLQPISEENLSDKLSENL